MMLSEVTYMKNTIIDLWYGNIAPCEHCGAHDVQANKLISLMERNREILRDGLTEAQKERFQTYIDCSEEFLLHMMELAFSDGFILGGRLAVDVLAQHD